MKAITTLGMIAREILSELFRASMDVFSLEHTGTAAENYKPFGGGNNQ